MHALKTLVTDNPGAALSAAGAGAGYAVSHGLREGAQAIGEGLREGVKAVGAALTPRRDDADGKVIEGKAVEVREAPRLTGPRRR